MQHKRNSPRPYGSGTLYQKSGAWYGRWTTDDRRMNRRLGPVRTPGERDGLTRSQAERQLRQQIERDRAAPVVTTRLTVEDAGLRLVTHLEALGRKKSTTEGARSTLAIHLAPFFKDKPLDRITREDVEAFVAHRAREGSAPKSTQLYLGTLHGIYEFAIRRGWATTNPVKQAERPRKADAREVRFLSMPEVEALLRAVSDDELGRVERVLYLAAATTGMRQGELIALRWRDVDWLAKRIRVRRSYVRGEFGTPKSKRSSRAVPLIDRLAGGLDQLSRSSAFTDDDHLVFGHPAVGSPLDRSKVLKRFKGAMRRAGLGHRLGEGGITFHSLRHCFGTAMAAQGVPMRTLQELMGHRDFATTLIYADYSPSAHEAEWAEAAFAGSGTDSGTEQSETERHSETPTPLS
jgi:integrase